MSMWSRVAYRRGVKPDADHPGRPDEAAGREHPADGDAGEDPDALETRLRTAWIGEPPRLGGPIRLVEYDPAWPGLFDREAVRIRAALGPRALQVEHVGSTAVPGLAAKPIIDVLLVVADPADERSYVPALEAAGYDLRIREPDWHEHRMLKGPDTDVNVHVHGPTSPEIGRMLAFRDRLRARPEERARYEAAKRTLAAREWRYVQEYADAKSAVVEAILAGASAEPEARR